MIGGAFNGAERVCRQTIKPAADQHSTILANQEAILNTCQNIKESLAKQQEDIKDLKTQPAKIGPTYAQLTRARMPHRTSRGSFRRAHYRRKKPTGKLRGRDLIRKILEVKL